MPQNIEDLLQLIDQADDYLEGLDLITPDTPLSGFDDEGTYEDADLEDLDAL